MYKLAFTHQYLKDLKLARKRNLNENELNEVIKLLLSSESLPEKYKDHPLKGNYKNYRDCHIENDWILIYEKNKSIHLITLIRTGTHSDLFK
jgi:mRNA interferase YafQ